MSNEITCIIKKTGVTLKSFSQPTNLDDLDEALDLFDVKFKIIMNKLIKNVPILAADCAGDASDDSTAEDFQEKTPFEEQKKN